MIFPFLNAALTKRYRSSFPDVDCIVLEIDSILSLYKEHLFIFGPSSRIDVLLSESETSCACSGINEIVTLPLLILGGLLSVYTFTSGDAEKR